jgi:hypothetical protein
LAHNSAVENKLSNLFGVTTVQHLLGLFAQRSDVGGGVAGLFCSLIELALIVVVIVGWWKVFEKAGKPGWASIIPFYNAIVLLGIAGKPWWWLLLCFIPFVNFVIVVIVGLNVAKAFGKEAIFGVGLILLPFIFYPILGFGDAQYQGAPQ